MICPLCFLFCCGRMKIETDTIDILSGVRGKKTLGGPIAIKINNKDY